MKETKPTPRIWRVNLSDKKPSIKCLDCKKELPSDGWQVEKVKDILCDGCVVARGLGRWWGCCFGVDKNDVSPRFPTIHTPKLPAGRFALQSLKDNTWIESVEPMRWTPDAKAARMLGSEWLNCTNWQWSNWYAARTAAQVKDAMKKKGKK